MRQAAVQRAEHDARLEEARKKVREHYLAGGYNS